MDAKTLEMMESNEKIDKAAGSLVRSLYRAVADHQYGNVGITVSLQDGHIQTMKETIEKTHVDNS